MKDVTLQQVIAAVQANQFVVIDDHCKDSTVKLDAVGIHTRGNVAHVVALMENVGYFSVNEVYLDDDGKPHLSRWSVGGTIQPHGDIDYGVEQYNESSKKGPFTPSVISDVVKAA